MPVTANELLGRAITEDYMPGGGNIQSLFLFSRNRPIFNFLMVREMLQDPRVTHGLRLIKGPILSGTQIDVISSDGMVDGFIRQQFTHFWRYSAGKALKALEWGYSGHEALYAERDGYIVFDMLRDMDPPDVKAVTWRGEIVGMKVKNLRSRQHQYQEPFIGIPKCFWHVHDRERHPIYGLSRLYSAHIPWWEVWSDGGYRDIRRLWFHKNAFEGGIMYHPPGVTRLQDGTVVSNKELARELIEKKRTGGVLTLPNTTIGPSGDARAWEYVPPAGNTIPAGLLEYGEILRTEVLEAMGIPPEVIESSGSEGFGSSSGRQIPQMAFYSVLQEIVNWLVFDFNNQILRHLVDINFGPVQYDIFPLPLMETLQMPQEQYGNDPNAEQEVDENGNPIEDEDDSDEIEEHTREEKTNKNKSKKTTKTTKRKYRVPSEQRSAA